MYLYFLVCVYVYLHYLSEHNSSVAEQEGKRNYFGLLKAKFLQRH
jgi:hypothetical protein